MTTSQTNIDPECVVFTPGYSEDSCLAAWWDDLDRPITVRVGRSHFLQDHPALSRAAREWGLVIDLGRVDQEEAGFYRPYIRNLRSKNPIIRISCPASPESLIDIQEALTGRAFNMDVILTVSLRGNETGSELQNAFDSLIAVAGKEGNGISLPPSLLRLFCKIPEADRLEFNTVIAEGVIPKCLRHSVGDEVLAEGFSPEEARACGATMFEIVRIHDSLEIGETVENVLDELQSLEDLEVGMPGEEGYFPGEDEPEVVLVEEAEVTNPDDVAGLEPVAVADGDQITAEPAAITGAP